MFVKKNYFHSMSPTTGVIRYKQAHKENNRHIKPRGFLANLWPEPLDFSVSTLQTKVEGNSGQRNIIPKSADEWSDNAIFSVSVQCDRKR